MAKYPRTYIQIRDLFEEARSKLQDYDIIMGRVRKEFDQLRTRRIRCHAFEENDGQALFIEVTRQCWSHLFKHPRKRSTKLEKLERALCLDMAVELLQKTTTYQEVSRASDLGARQYLYFGIVGYVQGNRVKTVIRKEIGGLDSRYILYSFYQMSSGKAHSKN